MRYQPAHAATDPVPFVLRAPQSLRLALSAAVAATVGFVPVVFVASPAQAAPGDVDFDSDIEAGEGDVFTFELRRTAGSADPLTLSYTTVDGTATAGTDYTPINGTTSFPGGSSRDVVKRFTVAGLQDALDETDETFTLRFTGTVNGNPVTIDAQGILDDDDATPSYRLSVPDPVAEAAGNARITATLSEVSGRDVVIPISTADGTAVQPADYTAVNAAITVQAGVRTGYLDVPIVDDARDEEDVESFTVTGATGGGGELNAGGQLTVNVRDDDVMPTVDVSDPGNVTEDGDLLFPVTLSAPSNRTVTVVADTSDGTATAGADYTPVVSQTVTFNPGETSKNVTVDTQADALNEVNPETLTLTLSSPVHAAAGDLTAVGGITDDDNPPVVSLTPSTVTEGDTGEQTRTFTVNLDAPSGREVRIGYQVNAGTAVAGEDFAAVTPGELVFAAGETSKTFTMTVLGDKLDETDETFSVVLSNPGATVTGPTLGPNTISITDDDATPEIATLTGLTEDEGDATATRTVRVELTNPSAQPITLEVTGADGTARAGGSGPGSDDYDLPSPTVTVPAGATGVDIPVLVNGDEVYERDETADLTVATVANDPNVVAGSKTSTLTFRNDDDAPTVALNAVAGAEGDTVTVTATVTGLTEDPIAVTPVATGAADGGSTAAQPADFDAAGLTLAEIPGGAVVNPLTVGTIVLEQDTIDEPDQAVRVSLTGIAGATPAFVTITDDANDMLPTITTGDATVGEAAGDVDIPATLDFGMGGNTATSTERTVSARWTTADGSAKQPGDYTGGSGTVTFEPGDENETITVDVADDPVFERDETFTVRLSEASPMATPLGAPSTVTITDNDSAAKPVFTGVTDVTFTEGSAPAATLSVELDRVTAEEVSFEVSAAPGSATSGLLTAGGNDYTAPAATVTVPAGSRRASITVPVTDDMVFERDEEATITVGLAGGEDDATGPDDTATLTIEDNDAAPVVGLNTVGGSEGTDLTVIATVTGMAQEDMELRGLATGYAAHDIDPAEASDFTDNGLAASVPAGSPSGRTYRMGTISLNQDDIDEYVETIRVVVADDNDVAQTTSGFYRINDDPNDLPPSVSISDETIGEGEGSVDLTISLNFDGGTVATEQVISVPWATANGTARAGLDFTARSGDVAFEPGDTERRINVPITQDELFENDQSFTVELGTAAPRGTEVTKSSGTVTILEDDEPQEPTLAGAATRVGAGPVTIGGTTSEGTLVRLYAASPSAPTSWTLVATTTAGATGAYSFTRALDRGTWFRTRADGLDSAPKLVRVYQAPVLAVSSPARGTVSFTVTANPALTGQAVTIQRLNANGVWSTIARGTTAGSTRSFATTLRNQRSGTATFRAYITADAKQGTLGGYSASRRTTVR